MATKGEVIFTAQCAIIDVDRLEVVDRNSSARSLGASQRVLDVASFADENTSISLDEADVRKLRDALNTWLSAGGVPSTLWRNGDPREAFPKVRSLKLVVHMRERMCFAPAWVRTSGEAYHVEVGHCIWGVGSSFEVREPEFVDAWPENWYWQVLEDPNSGL